MMLKSKRMAYDGKGNFVVKSEESIEEAYNKLGKSFYFFVCA